MWAVIVGLFRQDWLAATGDRLYAAGKDRQAGDFWESSEIMKAFAKSMVRLATVGFVLSGISTSFAQKPDKTAITEKDKQAYRNLMDLLKKQRDAQKNRVLQTVAIMNARQIGIALFEFETEYGSFPDAKTAVAVKEATETKADLKAATANDCFYQLMASGICPNDEIFTIKDPAKKRKAPARLPDHLEKCAFSYLIGMNAAGNPSRPVVIAPLVKGKEIFDPVALGGKAVVLRVDNSVQSFPIDEDGRVMINGKDIFDPAQPFWNGKVPEIRWPKD